MIDVANFLYRTHSTREDLPVTGPTKAEEEILEKHFAYMAEMTAKGVVHIAGRTPEADPKAFGLVVFQAENEEAARQVMENDPGIKLGVMWAELSPFVQNVYD